ncbi:hypothetical protein CHS0354_022469 [Potamilus streckersoni]|uniref:Uncharacterized protein n=1 Tax=Potamilus streckersoni TaxID=2493646 RepID=A0AAE0SXS3_9BIVA|nr:hypothetical protein CHS0354_022469 [Potamilus streckersoni]
MSRTKSRPRSDVLKTASTLVAVIMSRTKSRPRSDVLKTASTLVAEIILERRLEPGLTSCKQDIHFSLKNRVEPDMTPCKQRLHFLLVIWCKKNIVQFWKCGTDYNSS